MNAATAPADDDGPWFTPAEALVANELLHQTVRDVGDIRAKMGGMEARMDKTEETVDRMEGKLDLLVERSMEARGERKSNTKWLAWVGLGIGAVMTVVGALWSVGMSLADKLHWFNGK